jgi:hypothetical protein
MSNSERREEHVHMIVAKDILYMLPALKLLSYN